MKKEKCRKEKNVVVRYPFNARYLYTGMKI